MTEGELLKYATENGMIDLDTIKMNYEMNERKKYLGMHPFKIFFSKDGLWHTYLPDEKKGRVPRKRKNKDDLVEVVIQYWRDRENSLSDPINEKTTLLDLFPIWLKYKSIHTTSTSAIKRITLDWQKYYVPEIEFINKPIFKITKTELETWAYGMINKHHMTKKQYYNMSLIIRQALDYVADEDEKWTFYQVNKFRKFKIDRKIFRPEKKKFSESEIYSYEETQRIKDELDKTTDDAQDILSLAVYLWFYLGLRVGELVALKFEDIDVQRDLVYIHSQVVTEFIADENDITKMHRNGYKIVDYAKAHDERETILPDTAKQIIEKVKHQNLINGENNESFVFPRNGTFNLPQNFERAIKRVTKRAGVQYKSGHKIRKTYVSMLMEAGVNIRTIASMTGHKDILTTYNSYTFNPNSRRQIKRAFEEALM